MAMCLAGWCTLFSATNPPRLPPFEKSDICGFFRGDSDMVKERIVYTWLCFGLSILSCN